MFYVNNSNVHGKGAFCSERIARGQAFTCSVLPLTADDLEFIARTEINDKLFQFGSTACLVLSPLCMVNHSKDPNMAYTATEDNIIFYALRNIPAGAEILIDYKDFAKVLGLD